MLFYYRDADGIRTRKEENGITHEYYLSGSTIIGERRTGEGTDILLTYHYDINGISGFRYRNNVTGASKRVYYRKNIQGDIIGIIDGEGETLVTYVYDAWGNILLSSGNAELQRLNPFMYRGYYRDRETGWYYLNSRYYDPSVCRFINADDIGYINPESLNGLNLYVYCGNNPVMGYDPSGCFPVAVVLLAIAATLLFTPVGGIAAQVATSIVCYAGMALFSLWDTDIRADMNAIGWNPFNADESKVLNSNKVSFYKGMPVFLKNGGRSGSFYAISLDRNDSADDLRHERGHGWQAMMMGIGTYGITVGIPSPLVLGPWDKAGDYYAAPWETLADILGGVQSRSHNGEVHTRAWLYYATSLICPAAAYLFLLWK